MNPRYFDQTMGAIGSSFQKRVNYLLGLHPDLSPIEQGFIYGMVGLGLFDPSVRFKDFPVVPSATLFDITIHIQFPIKQFRADFAIELHATENGRKLHKWFVVECDGYQFHHLTREQVTRDKAREREIVAAGYSVLRFSGTEIYRDCTSAAQQVWTICYNEYRAWAE